MAHKSPILILMLLMYQPENERYITFSRLIQNLEYYQFQRYENKSQ